MCRLAFTTGPARPLSALLYDPPHALQVQAYAPREQQHGNVNVDGTGVVWWPEDDPAPLRYATTSPPWSDANLPALAPRLQGRTILAAVRGATPGIGFGDGLVAPFLLDGWAFTHNGWIGGFRQGVGASLVRSLPDALMGSIVGLSDSSVLFRVVLHHLDRFGDLPKAVTVALREVAATCRAHDQPATLNLLVTDGTEAVATRVSLGFPGNSLYSRTRPTGSTTEVSLASEPLDDDGWQPVPDGSLVHLRDLALTTTSLSLEP